MEEILALSIELLKQNTSSGNIAENHKVIKIVKGALNNFTIEEFQRNKHKSLLVHNKTKGHREFKIILNGHLDIIPGKNDQLSPKKDGNKLYGLGAMDMKSNVAAMICVFKKMAKTVKFPLALQLVTDEEIGGFDGTGLQVENGVRGQFVISGEATGLEIENRTKGVIWAKIKTYGKAAHSAYPWRGSNALETLNKVINDICKLFPNPNTDAWTTTCNLSSVNTLNKTFNKIPDQSELMLDIRYIPKDFNNVIKKLQTISRDNVELTIMTNEPPVNTPANNAYVQLLQDEIRKKSPKKGKIISANGSSDLRHYSKVGCQGVEFGPIGAGMGSDNEWVDFKSLEKFYNILENFLVKVEGY